MPCMLGGEKGTKAVTGAVSFQKSALLHSLGTNMYILDTVVYI